MTAPLAHGLPGPADLPIPAWLFAWAAALVLCASFVALAVLWRCPRLERERPKRVGRFPSWLQAACAATGLLIFAGVVVDGLAGDDVITRAVFVWFWVGIPLVSVVLGDVFSLFNPWLGLARVLRLGSSPRPWPRRLGRWPAAAGVLLFGWVELLAPFGDEPVALAVLALAYAATMLAGSAIYGPEKWTEHADVFAVVFSLFGRLAPLGLHEGAVYTRRPLSGATRLPGEPGTAALLCALLGVTAYDGALGGELPGDSVALGTAGLLIAVALLAAFYRLGVLGMRRASGPRPPEHLESRFAHTLIPIAFAYLVAHYFSLVVVEGLGVQAGAISGAAIWYVQVIALLVGHVGGLLLAHDRALVAFPSARAATRSQYWMLAVMVGLTCLGLWLLSAYGAI